MMISERELRIGNLLMDEASGEWLEVERIGAMIITKVLNRDKYSLTVGKLAGIPLSPEVLERCGFEKSDYEWNYNVDEESTMVLEFFSHTGRFHFTAWEGIRLGVGFEYLHQLQNFHFALTGQELKVRL